MLRNMPQHKYPVCSGEKVIKVLQSYGYRITHQKGSHVKLVKYRKDEKHIIVVPKHHELDKGTLRSIIRRLREYISEDEFLNKLKK